MDAHRHLVGGALDLRGAALLRLGALGEAVHHAQVIQGHVTLLAGPQIRDDLKDNAEIAGNATQAIHLPRPLSHIVPLDLGGHPAALLRVQWFYNHSGQSVAHVTLVHVHLQVALLHRGAELRRGEIQGSRIGLDAGVQEVSGGIVDAIGHGPRQQASEIPLGQLRATDHLEAIGILHPRPAAGRLEVALDAQLVLVLRRGRGIRVGSVGVLIIERL